MLKATKFCTLILLCLMSAAATAQKKITQGTITYALEYNLSADKQAMAAMLPQEYVLSFKEDLSKYKIDMGMFSSFIVYSNTSKESLSLIDVPIQNKKIAVKMNKEQTEKMAEMQGGNKDLEVTTTTDRKLIAGYNCTKFVCKDKNSGTLTDVWATLDILIPTNNLTTMFKDIKGVPLQFSTDANGVKTKITVKTIVEENVGEINMKIPNDYEIMLFDELIKQMGG